MCLPLSLLPLLAIPLLLLAAAVDRLAELGLVGVPIGVAAVLVVRAVLRRVIAYAHAWWARLGS